MITEVPGIRVGHWTEPEARTGCTVVLAPPGTIGSGEVRGGAPATREFALLDPTRTVGAIDAVVLSGGSAFGLAAADGVMGVLEEQGRGFETAAGLVPIVIGMSLFDLGVGDGKVRPGSPEGREAALAAVAGDVELGQVGAGTGATLGKWWGKDNAIDGGIVSATLRADDLIVSALVAVNALGAVSDGSETADPGPPAGAGDTEISDAFSNTTIGVIATNAKIDKVSCHLAAQSGHDGLARSLLPAHSAADGDALVVLATQEVEANAAHVRVLAQQVVAAAVRSIQ